MVVPFLTYLILFLVPLIVVPGIAFRFEPPKVLVTEVLIIILAAYLIATGKFAFKRANKYLFGLLGGLFLLSLGHLFLSPTNQNLFGNVFRLQGVVLFWILLVFAIIAQISPFRLKERAIYLCALLSLTMGALVFGSNSAGRWIGSLGEPNALAAVAVFTFPFVFLSFKSNRVKIISLIVSLLIINFSESRSALAGIIIQLGFLLMVSKLRIKAILASIISVFVIVLSLGLPILDRIYFLQTNEDPYAFRFEDRAEIWQVAINAGSKSPIFGSGIEAIQGRINQSAQEMNVNSQYQIIDSSHNVLLDYWIWGGLIAVIIVTVLIMLTISNLSKKGMLVELTIFLGLLTVLMFNPTTVSVLAGFWWIIGRSYAEDKE